MNYERAVSDLRCRRTDRLVRGRGRPLLHQPQFVLLGGVRSSDQAPPPARKDKGGAGAAESHDDEGAAVIAGVPTPLADALKRHSVVVLALVAPNSQVDGLTLAEAKAGAADAHAGFATIDVGNNAQVEALSALLGTSADAQNRLLDAPAVLVFQKPQALYVRLNGYVDASTVEQAAVNAAPTT